MNEKDREAGGIYLFDNEEEAQSYLDGPIVAALKSSPVISDISAKMFDVLEPHSGITRGPVTSEGRVTIAGNVHAFDVNTA